MSRRHPKPEESVYTFHQKLSFVFYSILPEYCPVLLELQVHGETIEKQASSETEKRRRKVTTPKLGILGDAVWKVTS